MEGTITIEQFGKLLQSEESVGALLRMLRGLQSVDWPDGGLDPTPDGGEMWWGGWH